ncbi:MAG: phosphotyrosine protein phosphatase [Planctomycetaceae bacterium]|nr:phosphotyrosine protein phosphatase [Planctomycetaceae bacterium]
MFERPKLKCGERTTFVNSPGAGDIAAKVAMRVLFLCSQNRLRSPTAEEVFSSYSGVEVASAGLNHDAETPLSPELLQWAEVIFVMEQAHRNKLSKRFRAHLHGKRVICLNIPDEFEFMDPELVRLLEAKVPRFLPRT